jgi:hypothetical protein
VSLSAGYLAAPKGSSRNVVVGLALNSRLSGGAVSPGGMNYALNDRLAIYGQIGKTASINPYLRSHHKNNFESTSLGLGLSYRFSLPSRTARRQQS